MSDLLIFFFFIFFCWQSDGLVSHRPRPWRVPSWSSGSGVATEELLSSSLGLSEKLPQPIIISIYRKSFIKRFLQTKPSETRGYLRMAAVAAALLSGRIKPPRGDC